MQDNTRTGKPVQAKNFWLVLSLLAVITSRAGHTFSWYTSKKGRIWATLKGFRPIQYSTSVELDASLPDSDIYDTLNVLYFFHFPKMRLEAPPLPTWVTRKDIEKHLPEALAYNDDLFARWQAGEMLWEDTSDMPNDNATLPGSTNDVRDPEAS